MRAKPRADAAVFTDNRNMFVVIKLNGAHYAGIHTFFTADAPVGYQRNAASVARLQRTRRTGFGTGAFLRTSVAYDADKTARHPCRGLNAYRAFECAVLVLVHRGTGQHAGEAPDALVHPVRSHHSWHHFAPHRIDHYLSISYNDIFFTLSSDFHVEKGTTVRFSCYLIYRNEDSLGIGQIGCKRAVKHPVRNDKEKGMPGAAINKCKHLKAENRFNKEEEVQCGCMNQRQTFL